MTRLCHYILNEDHTVSEVDLMTWAHWLESEEGRKLKIVSSTLVDEVRVSTVFLGLDHSFGMGGPALLFETMTFEKKISEAEMRGKKYNFHKSVDSDGYYARYATYEEALKGHAEIVEHARKGLRWNCEICGTNRADEDIAVYTYPLKGLPGLKKPERNLKYCKNNSDCFDKAIERGTTGEI